MLTSRFGKKKEEKKEEKKESKAALQRKKCDMLSQEELHIMKEEIDRYWADPSGTFLISSWGMFLKHQTF